MIADLASEAVIVGYRHGMSHEDWHALRARGVGGSECGAIMGESKWASPLDIYLDKVARQEGRPRDLGGEGIAEALYWGNRLEDSVIEEVANRDPALAAQTAVCPMLQHPGREFILANPDRLIVEGSRGRGIIEAKTSLGWGAREWTPETYPRGHFWQAQHYLAVLGPEYTFAALAGFVSGPAFHLHIIERDPEAIAALEDRCAWFWDCVTRRDPLALVDGSKHTADALAELFPGGGDQAEDPILLDGDAEIAQAIAAHDLAKTNEKRAKAERIAAENVIKSRMGDAHRAQLYGRAINWPQIVTSRFDGGRFKADHPSLWTEYLSATESRRFTIAKRIADESTH